MTLQRNGDGLAQAAAWGNAQRYIVHLENQLDPKSAADLDKQVANVSRRDTTRLQSEDEDENDMRAHVPVPRVLEDNSEDERMLYDDDSGY